MIAQEFDENGDPVPRPEGSQLEEEKEEVEVIDQGAIANAIAKARKEVILRKKEEKA